MLDKTIKVEKIVDEILLSLWNADRVASDPDRYYFISSDYRKVAQAYVTLLYLNVGYNDAPHCVYRGIYAPQVWIDCIRSREGKFEHPKEPVIEKFHQST